MTFDRIAVAIVRCPLWAIVFWLARPLLHIQDLRNADAVRQAFGDAVPWGPITWRHLLFGRDPRFNGE